MKLILGGAQLGSKYGVSNNRNGINKKDLIKIFKSKKISKIVDTAYNYKNSINVIKKYQKKFGLKVILKIDVGKKTYSELNFLKKIDSSFKKFKTNYIYCVMIHDTKNFFRLSKKKRDIILNKFKILKRKKKISKIGFSIYNQKELKKLKTIKDLDIIQLPINIFDQEFVREKNLSCFKRKKIEIHARSIFLQGLIFLGHEKIRKILKKKPIGLKRFYDDYKNSKQRMFHCINFIKNQRNVDKCVIGVTSYDEFKEVIKLFDKKKYNTNYSGYLIKDKYVTKPYLWSSH